MITIQDLVSDLSIQERALDLKYQIKLDELQKWVGDDRSEKRVNWQAYYQITGEDYRNAYAFALGRTISNIRDGIKDIFQGGHENAIEGDIIAMLGEISIAKLLGVEWDHNIKFGKSPKYDMIAKEQTIDAKACLRRNNWSSDIVVHQGKKLGDSERYFFGRMISNTIFNLYGWSPEEELILEENKREGKTGYWLPKFKLHKFHVKES